ncbi:MAG: class I SAM-dependent methyltransferase [Parasphingorhabdus sp.]
MDYDNAPPFEVARYREMQSALPGVDALYRLMLAQLEIEMKTGGHVLVVGAGGGREVEALCNSKLTFHVTGVDPSKDMLKITQWYAGQSARAENTQLLEGTTADVAAPCGGFDAATSILVMHFLKDEEGEQGKRAYLQAIRERLKPGGLFVHADISFDSNGDFERLKPVFLRHAMLVGLAEEDVKAGPGMIASLPIISRTETETLLAESGFRDAQLFFQTLWYRAWIARAE